ncbi:hypothetical protein SETIT_4G010700v2 [Setaria italica]|uniref:Embryo surrounding factor 1 brassicaceae domain-containing protein n=1 Tax=Setaria italica TaxID=4555 RepID=A0A368QPJ1_SETIT|nr:hypothetical protein SETIT_4G010700v2 [Setaria italica]
MNTRDRCGGALMLMFFLLFAFPAQCRPHHQELYVGTASLSNTTLDESKGEVVLRFCTKRLRGNDVFYCCWNKKPEPWCYDTWQECQAVCPLCDPQCPPAPGPSPIA